MSDYIQIIMRTLILYALILVIFRMMGKREIGNLSILDLVVFIMIAEMAVVAIENTNDPILHTIVPMVLLMFIQIGLAFLSLKNKKFRDMVDGHPSLIINKGKIDRNEMKRHRYNYDDLMVQLREKNVRNIADVEFAILETSGKLSVFEREKNKDGEITIPLILDGEIQLENLQKINQTKEWLEKNLQRRGYSSIQEISFCSFQKGQFYIDVIDEKKK